MRAIAYVLVLSLLCLRAAHADPRDRTAFQQTLPTASKAEEKIVLAGRALFHQAWIVAPSLDQPELDGLGPLYNQRSCIACHIRNGRGEPSENANDRMRSTLVRLSIPGTDGHGGPKPHPAYGGQFNTQGIPGVAAEGTASTSWHAFTLTLGDGTKVPMRAPRLVIRDLAYGPLGKTTMTSVRVAPPIIGLGLLSEVPDEEILAVAEEEAAIAHVHGRPNYVWDMVARRTAIGRFGFKANQPNLGQQISTALLEDMGLTSYMHPAENCTGAEPACRAAPNGGSPELDARPVSELVAYVESLVPPAPRGSGDPRIIAGGALFATMGCADCHRPSLHLGRDPSISNATDEIHPYTDLLLHDMGKGLSDGRPDYGAGPRDWRTPPLWGIGLTAAVADRATYLHDGRARSLTEAILWHGGEAGAARNAFSISSAADRSALLAFLHSL